MSRAEQLAATIAGMAPLAIRNTLSAVHQGCELPLAEALALEASLFGKSCGTEDKAEGTRAFAEKRPANWKGR
jgi:enoyl-CoA hydratase